MVKNDIILTQDLKDSGGKELLSHIGITDVQIVEFTYSSGAFMFPKPKPIQKTSFNKFKLGKITGNLSRKELYEDR